LRHSKETKVRFAGVEDEDENEGIDYGCLPRVEDICESLATCLQEDHRDCLRFFLNDKRKLWAIDTSDSKFDVEMDKSHISLENLLSQTQNKSRILKNGQRLSLAVHLASSLVQLHGTPWLRDDWWEKSIYFPVRDIEQPYVMIKFGTELASAPSVPNPVWLI
jgi:hypothetical protein